MATRARHGSYLFKRPESSMWWLRLRSDGKAKVHSLKTADKTEAERLACEKFAVGLLEFVQSRRNPAEDRCSVYPRGIRSVVTGCQKCRNCRFADPRE